MTAWLVRATNTMPRNTKPTAQEEIQSKRRRPARFRVLRWFGAGDSSEGISKVRTVRGTAAVNYFAGSTLDRSAVSSSGVLPAGMPFCCNRNAMILTEFLAETEPGAIMGISVCTADQSVETFLPP